MPKTILTAILFFLFTGFVFSQTGSKEQLQKQREQLKNEIEQTEKILNETRKTTKENLGQLSLLNRKLDLQDNVVQNISGQIKFIDNDIFRSQKEVNKLSRVLDTLKQEYAKSMVYAYKNRNSYDFLNFIFSASSFNDAIKRITYLKSYRSYREMQGENISRTQQLLHLKINDLSGNKQQKNAALVVQNQEMTELEKQQAEKESVVQKLKGRQKELTALVSNKRKQDAKLRGMISTMIRREIENARKKAEADKAENDRLARLNKPKNDNNNVTTRPTVTKVPKHTESVLVTSEADRVLDANFERNRGSLPWPANGFILNHFGRNQYPGGVEYDNPQVNIGTQVGGTVKAIFDGEVTLVNYMDDKQIVFIKHGKYFSVYSNLSSASVQRGQSIKTGQVIGKAAANDDGQGEVDLMIMKETNNVNPELWLHK
ncbi:MAG: peptidoglycan DD-metalloendopeptidase family protein [Chitinophagaceae bacterium]|nr:peptidoglycan DD-metalloendopeptidase family protein [Chitinophagaceae bacterium]